MNEKEVTNELELRLSTKYVFANAVEIHHIMRLGAPLLHQVVINHDHIGPYFVNIGYIG